MPEINMAGKDQITVEHIECCIYMMRGEEVIMDSGLANNFSPFFDVKEKVKNL